MKGGFRGSTSGPSFDDHETGYLFDADGEHISVKADKTFMMAEDFTIVCWIAATSGDIGNVPIFEKRTHD